MVTFDRPPQHAKPGTVGSTTLATCFLKHINDCVSSLVGEKGVVIAIQPSLSPSGLSHNSVLIANFLQGVCHTLFCYTDEVVILFENGIRFVWIPEKKGKTGIFVNS